MTKKALFMTIIALVISFKTFATLFHVISLEQMIEESSSGAEVELLTKKTYKNKFDVIMTDFSFKVIEGYNLNESEMNNNVLIISMAGGTIDGITSFIDSAPEFSVGEKSFLLLKKMESKFYLSNFTMGKYKIEEVQGQTYYISSVFPNDSDLGRVKKERMIDLMKLKFEITRAPEPDSYKPQEISNKKLTSIHRKKLEERNPAQVKDSEKKEFYEVIIGFIVLFIVSGLMVWWKFKKGASVN